MNAQRKIATPVDLRRAIGAEVRDLTRSEQALLTYCELAASEGRELESSEEIADELGYESVSMCRYILQGLERKGYIRIESYQRGRRVWVRSLDRWTKAPPCTVPHWRSVQARSPQTPTVPIHIVEQQVPTLAVYLHRMMKDENLTMVAAQIALMSRGAVHREMERSAGK